MNSVCTLMNVSTLGAKDFSSALSGFRSFVPRVVCQLSLLTFKMVLMTLYIFLFCTPNDPYECPIVLLNVD